MPVYRKAKNKWLVRVYHKGRPLTRTVDGSKKDALAFEARWRRELETAGATAPPRVVPRFSDFCLNQYKKHAELKLSPNWWRKQRSMLSQLIEFFGDDKLSEIDMRRVEAYHQQRLTDGLRAVSVNNEVRVLSRVLNFAREMRFPVPEPKFRPIKERVKYRKPKAWTDAEIDRLLEAIDTKCPWLMGMVVFMLNTGCRAGEVLAVTWERIDLKNRLVQIWPSDEWQPKDGEPREIPISDALMPWLSRPGELEAPVFPSRKGTRYATWPQNTFDRARDAAEIEGGPHRLRHTYATKFLQRQPDLFLLARVMGHDDTTVTRRYGHLMPDHLTRARNAVCISFPTAPPGPRSANPSRPSSAPGCATRPND